jgi:TolB-like protein
MFELTQTSDLSRWTGDPNEPGWRAFLADVRRFIEACAAPLPPPSRPSTQAAPSPSYSATPSLAVLPFINRSGVERDDVFTHGLVEDLTAALSVSPGTSQMTVVAASATAIYGKAARDLRQIGRDLGVRYLLEGNVRPVGEDLRVTAQLIEAESGRILWTQRFDRPFAEISALQEDLVTEVAAHLGVQVYRAEMELALKKPGRLGGWEASMRADAHAIRATRSGWEAAVAEQKRAVEMDPDDGVAYSVLAGAQSALLPHRGVDDPDLAQEIIDNIRRARALDPDSPVVLSNIAPALMSLGELQEALALAERAVAISPNLAQAHLALGGVLVRLGRSDEALFELDAVERLEPSSPWLYYALHTRAVAHLRAGRLDQALAAADQAVRLRLGMESLVPCMLCLAKLGRWDLACDALRRLRDANPEITCGHIENFVRSFFGGSNDGDEYLAIPRRVWDEAPGEPKSR